MSICENSIKILGYIGCIVGLTIKNNRDKKTKQIILCICAHSGDSSVCNIMCKEES